MNDFDKALKKVNDLTEKYKNGTVTEQEYKDQLAVLVKSDTLDAIDVLKANVDNLASSYATGDIASAIGNLTILESRCRPLINSVLTQSILNI